MKKYIYILVVLVFGLFFSPVSVHACKKNTTADQKSCCNDETAEVRSRDCCKKGALSGPERACDGQCDNATCYCHPLPHNVIAPTRLLTLELKNVNLFIERSYTFYRETYTSPGFTLLWLPPKIT